MHIEEGKYEGLDQQQASLGDRLGVHRASAGRHRGGSDGMCTRRDRSYSGLIPANLITLANFSVSSEISRPKAAGEPASAMPPNSAIRALILGSARPIPIALLSLSIFQGGQRRPGDFGRERREFAGGLRPNRTLPRSSCLARCSSCGSAALPRCYVSRWGEGGPLCFRAPVGGHRYTSRAASAEPFVPDVRRMG
jgi:hypothetical protein